MARNLRLVPAPPATVFSVLSDPRAYATFVVGSKRIRRFDPTWPAVGSVFHHTLGVGPFILRDSTEVVELEEPHRLVLLARMRPFAANRVEFVLVEAEGDTQVEVQEHPVEGPAAALWNRLLDGVMWLRNREMLRRLDRLSRRRLATQLRATS